MQNYHPFSFFLTSLPSDLILFSFRYEEHVLFLFVYGGDTDGVDGNTSGACSDMQPVGSDHMSTCSRDGDATDYCLLP